MKLLVRIAPILFLLAVIVSPQALLGATGDITFQVIDGAGNVVYSPPISNGTSLTVSGPIPTTGTALITFAQGSTFNTDGSSDLSADTWTAGNTVRITANQAVSHLHIIYKRQHPRGPVTGTYSVYYKTWANGVINNGNGTISLTGAVTHIATNQTLQIGPVQMTGPNIYISSVAKWDVASLGSLLTDRTLQLDLDLSLSSGATLDLSTGWMKLRSQGTPDNPITAVSKHDLNFLQMTTYAVSTGYPVNIIDDDPLEKNPKVNQFAEQNHENLLQDMAQGGGEHLAALATLLDVPTKYQPAFFRFAQDHYKSYALHEASRGPDDVLMSLQEAMVAHPTWQD